MIDFYKNETDLMIRIFGVCVFILSICYLSKYALKRRKYSRILPSRPQYFVDIFGDLSLFPFNEKVLNGYPLGTIIWQYIVGNFCMFENQDIFCFWASYVLIIGITSPEAIEEVLSGTKYLEKAWFYELFHRWLGKGILTSPGEKWKSHRKLLSPSFHSTVLKYFMPIIDEKSKLLVEKWKKEISMEYTNITPHLTQCSLNITSHTLLGVDLKAQESRIVEYVNCVEKILESSWKRVINPFYWTDFTYFLTSGRHIKKYIKNIHNFAFSAIRARKKDSLLIKSSELNNSSNRKPFMETLLEYHTKNKEFTEENIREQVNTFMFGGYDTTSLALTWSLYLIGLYKDVQYKIYEELDRIFGHDIEKPVTAVELSDMKYLECVIKETLRLFPSVPMFGRTACKNTVIGGYSIPEGTPLGICPYSLHRNKKLYPNPEKFDPNRFTPENSRDRHPYAYLPFSAGPRNCIGQRLAIMELKTVLANILRNFTLESLDPRDKLIPCYGLTLNPSMPVRIKIRQRNKSL